MPFQPAYKKLTDHDAAIFRLHDPSTVHQPSLLYESSHKKTFNRHVLCPTSLNRCPRSGLTAVDALPLAMRGSFHEEVCTEGIEGGLGGDVDAGGLVDPAGLVVEEVVVIGGGGGVGIAAPEAET
jgi:hypothetical protein